MSSTSSGSSAKRRAANTSRTAAERAVVSELHAWATRALPDTAAPLDADDLVRLMRSCIDAVGVDASVATSFSVNTVHYYRRKDIIDAPEGRTVAARYSARHLWQVLGARLAGHLGLVTLAEARTAMRRANDDQLIAFVAARVVDARTRAALRAIDRSAARAPIPTAESARPLPGRAGTPATPPGVLIPLPGGAWCVIPAAHQALHSSRAADELARALTRALTRAPAPEHRTHSNRQG